MNVSATMAYFVCHPSFPTGCSPSVSCHVVNVRRRMTFGPRRPLPARCGASPSRPWPPASGRPPSCSSDPSSPLPRSGPEDTAPPPPPAPAPTAWLSATAGGSRVEEAATAAARAVATAWEAAVSTGASAGAGAGRRCPPPIALGLLFVTPDGGGAAGVARSVAAVRRTLALQGVLTSGQDLPLIGCSVASIGVDDASGEAAAAAVVRQATVASLTLFAPGGGVAAAPWAVSSTDGGVDWEWRQGDWRTLLGLGPQQVPPPSRAGGGTSGAPVRGEPSAVLLFQAPGAAAVGAGLFAGLDFALPGVPVAGVVAGVPVDSTAGVADDATLIYHAPPRRVDSGAGREGADATATAGDATPPLSAASRKPPLPPVTGRGDGSLRLCGIVGVALLGPVAVDARVVRGAIPVGPLLEVRAVVGPPTQSPTTAVDTAGAARAAGDKVYGGSGNETDVLRVDGVGCRLTLVEEVGTTLGTSAAPGTLVDMWTEGGVVPPALAAALSGGEVLVGVAVEGGRLAVSTSGGGPSPSSPQRPRPTLIEALRSGGAGLSGEGGGNDPASPPITLYRAGWATDDGGDGNEGWRGEGLGGTPQVGAHMVLPGGVVRVGQLLRLYVAGGDVLPPSARVPADSIDAGSAGTEPRRTADADAVDVAADPAISTTNDAPQGSTAREWAAAMNVLGLEMAGRAADGWVPVGAVAFCRDGITVSAVTAGLAARLGVDPSAVVGVDAGAGGAVGNVGGVGRGEAATVTAVTAAAVSYFVVYARGDGLEEHMA